MILTNKAVLITGGKRIGAAVAERSRAAGWMSRCRINDRRTKPKPPPPRCAAAGRRAVVLQANLSRGDDCAALVDRRGRGARPSRRPRQHGVGLSLGAARRDRRSRVGRGLDVDLKAAFLCARAAVPHMRAAGGGRIINFSDWVAASGRPRYTGYLPYYVAKRASSA